MDRLLVSLNVLLCLVILFVIIITIRCCLKGKTCPSKHFIDGKTVLITRADNSDGIQLVKALSQRGGRIIMACQDVNLGQDIAIEIRGETNGEIIVEHVNLNSLKSIRQFCTKILETETKIHILINNNIVQWVPESTTLEGHETHWGINHLAVFTMTQLLMPLLHRGSPDSRILTLTSSWYTRCNKINWDDPNFRCEKYSAMNCFAQSKLANILFSRELARRLDGTGINTYVIDPGPVKSGLGIHIIKGLGWLKTSLALICWLPWVKSSKNGIQTILYCATDENIKNQSGFFYRNCAVHLTNEKASDMDSAYRLWEMTERIIGLTS